MRIELSVQQGVLSARLETETAAAKSVLLDNLPALRDRLAAQDIRVERFDVDVRQDSSGGQPDWQAQQESRAQHQERRSSGGAGGRARQEQENSPESSARKSPLQADGRFNAVA
jgi:flagellar hook-length control protein FliK